MREIKPMLLISVKYKRITHTPKNPRKYRVLFLMKDYLKPCAFRERGPCFNRSSAHKNEVSKFTILSTQTTDEFLIFLLGGEKEREIITKLPLAAKYRAERNNHLELLFDFLLFLASSRCQIFISILKLSLPVNFSVYKNKCFSTVPPIMAPSILHTTSGSIQSVRFISSEIIE